MAMKFIDEMDLKDKKLLIRVDYNVPLDGETITDDMRIRASLPTLRLALDKGAALILCSHLGKAKGTPDPKFSLKPAAKRLSELLGQKVIMAPDCVGPEVSALVEALKPGDVMLLENLRFHAGEEKNDPEFSAKLAALAEVYVNDAFGTAHRAHASTYGVPSLCPLCCAGLLMKKEWEYLGQAVENPAKPFVAVSGGAKVSSKIGVLMNLLGRVDRMIIGGAMANTFLKALGLGVGKSLVEDDLLDKAREILATAKERKVSFYLPVDFTVSFESDKKPLEMKSAGVFAYQDIPDEAVILDIGPASVKLFSEVLSGTKTVVWNGPMGVFENPEFAAGTLGVAKAIVDSGALSIVGGGDTDAVIHQNHLEDKFGFISTGGGASMEFLEGKELPAFKILKECGK